VPAIRKMGAIADKNVADVKEMKKLRAAALKELEPAIAAMDIAVWNRANGKVIAKTGDDIMGLLQDPDKLLRSPVLKDARNGLNPLGCRHLMACFPEVFLRKSGGFDVMLGNPPWEKIHFEEPQFWGRYVPGYFAMNSVRQKEEIRQLKRRTPSLDALLENEKGESKARSAMYTRLYGDLPKTPERYGKSAGHPDFFKLFAWRFWDVLRPGGIMGIVLPRGAFSGDATSPWRKFLFTGREPGMSRAEVAVTVVTNNGGWVFEDIHQQYSVCLCVIRRKYGPGVIKLNGPFRNYVDFQKGRLEFASFPVAEVSTWSQKHALPLIPSSKAGIIFKKIRECPNIIEQDVVRRDSVEWICRPLEELNSTSDKYLFNQDVSQFNSKSYPVYKGESFDLWVPDRGKESYYGQLIDNEKTLDILYNERRRNHARGDCTAFSQYDPARIDDRNSLDCLSPRIAFRDITNRTNTRTIIAALLPPGVVCTDVCPVLLFPKGRPEHITYVLGVLCSRVCDWYARRWVEMHLTFTLFGYLPVPKPHSSDKLFAELVAAAGRLACPDERFAKWAKSIGVECGPLKPEEKQELVDCVDAVAALLYNLSEQELETVFETFHEGWDWKQDHARVLAKYRLLKGKYNL
jgi:hypothetical protein